MQALEGEVILSKDRVKFSPAKRSLLTKDYKIDLISQICSYHTKNAASSINLDLQDPCSILAPHYNLGELRKIDIDSR